MFISQEQLVQLAANGANLKVSSKGMTQEQLVQLAALSAQRGGHLTVVVTGLMSQQQLVQLAAIGKNGITLDFTA